MTEPSLDTPIQFLQGVGSERAELLAKLGIETVEDLLWHLPRSVLDLTDVRPVNELEEDQLASVCGKVVDLDARTISRGRTISTAEPASSREPGLTSPGSSSVSSRGSC